MRNYFRVTAYVIVAACVSYVNAGSYEDFFVAVRNDNAAVVTDLLARGFEPNARDPKGQTGLAIAMQARSLNAAKALIASPGVDLDALNASGESALMFAALKGNLAGMQMLIERGARIDQPGWSAIHYAATGPEPRAVQLLLERGAEINAASPNQTTPLMMAAQYGTEDSVALLLKRGADMKRRNQRDLGAADFARLAGREALAKRLEQLAQ